MAYIYILESLKTGQYYIGCTLNYKNRIKEHNKGLSSSTKSLSPFVLKLVQEYKTLSEARKIELKLKKLKRKDYLNKIIKDGSIKMHP
jgi:predicted GIY-YIG superfamily endonuclease